jgi:hypothetical protein
VEFVDGTTTYTVAAGTIAYIKDRIGSALRGENPSLMGRLPQSFAVMGDIQWLPA